MENQKVYVLTATWNDRHGDGGNCILGVFRDEADAEAKMRENKKSYLKDFGVLSESGEIDTGSLYEVDGESPDGKTYEDLMEASTITIDSDGTYCFWDISEEEVL
jgi:hypothetical protein